jgi:hypothetical protein
MWLNLSAVWRRCRCVLDGQFQQAVGVTIESRRLDKLEEVIKRSPNMVDVVTYALNVCKNHIVNREFRQQVWWPPQMSCSSTDVSNRFSY